MSPMRAPDYFNLVLRTDTHPYLDFQPISDRRPNHFRKIRPLSLPGCNFRVPSPLGVGGIVWLIGLKNLRTEIGCQSKSFLLSFLLKLSAQKPAIQPTYWGKSHLARTSIKNLSVWGEQIPRSLWEIGQHLYENHCLPIFSLQYEGRQDQEF